MYKILIDKYSLMSIIVIIMSILNDFYSLMFRQVKQTNAS